jgi:hypothetical protein
LRQLFLGVEHVLQPFQIGFVGVGLGEGVWRKRRFSTCVPGADFHGISHGNNGLAVEVAFCIELLAELLGCEVSLKVCAVVDFGEGDFGIGGVGAVLFEESLEVGEHAGLVEVVGYADGHFVDRFWDVLVNFVKLAQALWRDKICVATYWSTGVSGGVTVGSL